MQTDQRGRGLGQGDAGHRIQDAEAGAEADARNEHPSAQTVDQIMFGIVSIAAHETLEINGLRSGFQMGVVDPAGNKYFVEIPEEVYTFLSQAYMSVVSDPQQMESESPATGSAEEIAAMQKLLEDAEAADVSPLASIGFVGDHEMPGAKQNGVIMPGGSGLIAPPNPVDELLSMVGDQEQYDFDSDDDYDDDDDEPDIGEDIGQL